MTWERAWRRIITVQTISKEIIELIYLIEQDGEISFVIWFTVLVLVLSQNGFNLPLLDNMKWALLKKIFTSSQYLAVVLSVEQ